MITRKPIRLAAGGFAATLGIAATLGLTGCGDVAERAAEEAIEQGSGGDVDLNLEDDSLSIEGEDGSLSIGGGEMPEDFPADVTLPDGGTVVAGSSFEQGGNKGWLVESTYPDDPKDLADTVEGDLTGGGFDQVGTYSTNETTTATYEGNGYDVVTAVTGADSGSSLTVTVSESAG